MFCRKSVADTEEDVCIALLEYYLQDNAKNPRVNHTTLRMDLAAYCACKSCGATLSNPLLDWKKSNDKPNHFAAQAIHILNDLLTDKIFEDKADLQPLTLLCMVDKPAARFTEGRFINIAAGYRLLKGYLIKHMSEDAIVHTIMQLMVHNEHSAVQFLQFLRANQHLLFEQKERVRCLWYAAELFNCRHAMDVLAKIPILVYAGIGNLSRHTCQEHHLNLSWERAILLGDCEKLKNFKLWRSHVWSLDHTYCTSAITMAITLGYGKLVQCALEIIREDGQPLIDVDQEDIEEAVDCGQVAIIKLLLAHHPAMFDEGVDDRTYVRAMKMRYFEAIQCIVPKLSLRACADVLKKAIKNAAFGLVEFMLDHIEGMAGDPTVKTEIVRDALCDAAGQGSIKMLELFVKRSIALNGFAGNPPGNPLHLIVSAFCTPPRSSIIHTAVPTIAFLLAHGACDEPAKDGRTALASY